MQLIEGQTLSTLLRSNGPFGAHEAALIGVDFCRALAAVHAAGLIHGDVKTRNVMREAAAERPDGFRNRAGPVSPAADGAREAAAGTPLYLAPEVSTAGRDRGSPTSTASASCCTTS